MCMYESESSGKSENASEAISVSTNISRQTWIRSETSEKGVNPGAKKACSFASVFRSSLRPSDRI